MPNKLWQKSTAPDQQIEAFTVGRDRELDPLLAPFDILGSLAHIRMLRQVGLLAPEEEPRLRHALQALLPQAENAEFAIEEGVEDVHSQVELLLTRQLGDLGKKIHAGRSRNDQVLLDLKLYTRHAIGQVVEATEALFQTLQHQAEKHQDHLIPGYTHMQVAMPSSIGLWLGAYAESLCDDLLQLQAAFRIANRNPLGSAAGYGSSFPLDRQLTSQLLGFEGPVVNSVYAQMGRGKTERTVAQALASLAQTLAKLSMDATLYMGQDFGFISFPDNLTTGSSIMPHKKNPDVFELLRAKGNQLASLPNEIQLITGNLPSGYHRDLQLIKENFLPAFDTLLQMLQIAEYMLRHLKAGEEVIRQPKYHYIFSVERVNQLVGQGVPFRDAYRQVGQEIETGQFEPNYQLNHSHLGSIGNLGLEQISERFGQIKADFGFPAIEEQLQNLRQA